MPAPWPLRVGALLLLAHLFLLAGACRKGSDKLSGGFIPVVPVSAGTQGCGPSAGVLAAVAPVFASAVIGPKSQIAAVAGDETLYLTGDDGSIHELVFPLGGGPPSDTELVAPGVIAANILVPLGILTAAELSGVAILDAQFLAVAEHSSNTLLLVDRLAPDTVSRLAGLPSTSGGKADGLGGGIRFHFSAPVPLLADASGVLFVGDTENHSLRQLALGAVPEAITITGSGAAGFNSGLLPVTLLDTPSGFAASCAGELLMVESGSAGQGGHVLLRLAIGAPSIFGGFDGQATVLAGDGTAATVQGVDGAAELAAPKGLVATQDGVLFWVDSATGNLRRYATSSGLSDCPLFQDCAAAVTAGGSFTVGGAFALALGSSGAVYVLDAGAGTLFRVTP